MRENRLLRAEKELLTILKIDERNAAAYNRLGILYAKQHEYRDAIDCFEIASSIEASPSSRPRSSASHSGTSYRAAWRPYPGSRGARTAATRSRWPTRCPRTPVAWPAAVPGS